MFICVNLRENRKRIYCITFDTGIIRDGKWENSMNCLWPMNIHMYRANVKNCKLYRCVVKYPPRMSNSISFYNFYYLHFVRFDPFDWIKEIQYFIFGPNIFDSLIEAWEHFAVGNSGKNTCFIHSKFQVEFAILLNDQLLNNDL